MDDGTATSSRQRRRLSDAEVEYLARSEMPELTKQLRSVAGIVSRLQRLNAINPQRDLDGLHSLVDSELRPLLIVQQKHSVVRVLIEFNDGYPDLRPPLLTKVVALGLLTR